LEHVVGEEHATLPAGEAPFDAAAVELDHEAPAELHVGVVRALQPRSNLSANIRESPGPDNRPRYQSMARQITCECGQIVRGETENEVVDLTLEHLRSDHPQLVDRITRDEIVALIEIVE
jgi:predicted small metal-binding protein